MAQFFASEIRVGNVCGNLRLNCQTLGFPQKFRVYDDPQVNQPLSLIADNMGSASSLICGWCGAFKNQGEK
jgi:hypothetical protein